MPQPYYWWHGSDLADFFAKVTAKGLNNVRIEFHPHEETPLLYVKPKDGGDVSVASDTEDDGFNYSHRCPPDC